MPPNDIDPRIRAALAQEPLSLETSEVESQVQLQALHNRMHQEDAGASGETSTVRRVTPVHLPRGMSERRSRPFLYALTGLAAAAVIAGTFVIGQHSGTTQFPVETYTTRNGQRATVTLADGSHVTLAPATTIRVEHKDGTRVTLDGEAYFDVAHRTQAPFVVVTGRVITRVLGTAFDVRHYAGDKNARVAVSNGKVTVGVAAAGAPSVTVTAGTIATVSDSTAVTTVVGDVSNYTTWTHGALAFTHMPASDVLNTLGHWYGYEFKLQDSTLASHLLTVRFDGESEDAVLRSLSVILDVTLSFNGHVVTLTPKRINPKPAQSRRDRYDLHTQQQTTEVGR